MSRKNAWYINSQKGAEGPFATDFMRAMVRDHRLGPLDLVFREGDDEWRPVSMFSELQPESADAEMAKAFRTLENLPDLSPSNSANSTNDGAETHGESSHSWIVLRPHGSTYLQAGPFKTEQIREGLKQGTFNFGQYAWHVGMAQWMRIGDLREFDRRSTPRERTPHVPPPLPDPITSVLLEDDGDFESEEFHVSVNAQLRADLTPVDFFNLGKEAFAVGGAAAKNPERADSLVGVVGSARDLAKVPWEERLEQSGVFTQAVELIDDESSIAGVQNQFEDQDDVSSHTDYYETPRTQEIPYVAVSESPVATTVGSADTWMSWGRYVGAAGFAFVAGTFALHLATAPAGNALARGDRKVIEAEPLLETSSSPVVRRELAAETMKQPIGDAKNVSTAKSPEQSRPPVSQIEIVGLKLQDPEGAVLLQGAIPVGVPIKVTFHGRVGEVLGSLNVRKAVSVTRNGAEIPSVQLKKLALPTGAYTVQAELDSGALAKADIFVGKRDARFLDRLEAHLREHAYELQSQKKLLFYAAQELDVLARDLGLNYGQLRSRSELWTKFYQKWLAKMSAVEKTIVELHRRDPTEQAYPDESERLAALVKSLRETADQFQRGVGTNRDVASDTLTDLIAELTRQKATIGAISVRPNGSDGASELPVEKTTGVSNGDPTSQGL